MTNLLCDMHIHTVHSADSVLSLEDYCEKAVRRGAHAICFTDHVDLNPNDPGYGKYDVDAFFSEFLHAKEKYRDRLTVLGGIEFGEPHIYKEEFARYSALDFDFVMGVIHFWYKDMFTSAMVRTGVPAEECYDIYWKEVLAAVTAGGFDCLGHMDFPKRYYKKVLYDPDMIAEICTVMARNNISLEINTSSLRRGVPEAMPDKDLLPIYKSCGGKYLALGSDSHKLDDLLAGIPYAKELVAYYGFEEVIYEKRIPRPIRQG